MSVGCYSYPKKPVHASGTTYNPLQTDGETYLCPECGGYGTVPGEAMSNVKCDYCKGNGWIALNDERIINRP